MKISTAIVGTKFRGPDAVRTVMAMDRGEPVTLKHERDNPHDPNAISCHSPNGKMVGYIPRNCPQQPAIAAALLVGKSVRAEIEVQAIVDCGEIRFAPKISVRWED